MSTNKIKWWSNNGFDFPVLKSKGSNEQFYFTNAHLYCNDEPVEVWASNKLFSCDDGLNSCFNVPSARQDIKIAGFANLQSADTKCSVEHKFKQTRTEPSDMAQFDAMDEKEVLMIFDNDYFKFYAFTGGDITYENVLDNAAKNLSEQVTTYANWDTKVGTVSEDCTYSPRWGKSCRLIHDNKNWKKSEFCGIETMSQVSPNISDNIGFLTNGGVKGTVNDNEPQGVLNMSVLCDNFEWNKNIDEDTKAKILSVDALRDNKLSFKSVNYEMSYAEIKNAIDTSYVELTRQISEVLGLAEMTPKVIDSELNISDANQIINKVGGATVTTSITWDWATWTFKGIHVWTNIWQTKPRTFNSVPLKDRLVINKFNYKYGQEGFEKNFGDFFVQTMNSIPNMFGNNVEGYEKSQNMMIDANKIYSSNKNFIIDTYVDSKNKVWDNDILNFKKKYSDEAYNLMFSLETHLHTMITDILDKFNSIEYHIANKTWFLDVIDYMNKACTETIRNSSMGSQNLTHFTNLYSKMIETYVTRFNIISRKYVNDIKHEASGDTTYSKMDYKVYIDNAGNAISDLFDQSKDAINNYDVTDKELPIDIGGFAIPSLKQFFLDVGKFLSTSFGMLFGWIGDIMKIDPKLINVYTRLNENYVGCISDDYIESNKMSFYYDSSDVLFKGNYYGLFDDEPDTIKKVNAYFKKNRDLWQYIAIDDYNILKFKINMSGETSANGKISGSFDFTILPRAPKYPSLNTNSFNMIANRCGLAHAKYMKYVRDNDLMDSLYNDDFDKQPNMKVTQHSMMQINNKDKEQNWNGAAMFIVGAIAGLTAIGDLIYILSFEAAEERAWDKVQEIMQGLQDMYDYHLRYICKIGLWYIDLKLNDLDDILLNEANAVVYYKQQYNYTDGLFESMGMAAAAALIAFKGYKSFKRGVKSNEYYFENTMGLNNKYATRKAVTNEFKDSFDSMFIASSIVANSTIRFMDESFMGIKKLIEDIDEHNMKDRTSIMMEEIDKLLKLEEQNVRPIYKGAPSSSVYIRKLKNNR